MSERVNMPALGESVTEGTVTRWLKQVGDAVALDEPLLEVSTDKVDTEIPSPVAGVLQEILVAEDETVPVGAALAVIGDAAGTPADDAVGSTEPAAERAAKAPVQSPPAEPEPALAEPEPAALAEPVRAGALERGMRKSTAALGTQPRWPPGSLQYIHSPCSPSTLIWLPAGSDSPEGECSAGSGCTAARSAVTIARSERSAAVQ